MSTANKHQRAYSFSC